MNALSGMIDKTIPIDAIPIPDAIREQMARAAKRPVGKQKKADVPRKDAPPAVASPTIQAIGAGTLAGKEFAPLVEPVKGLIVEGLTLLCGASKIGKSWLVLQMCAAVASGTPFLGRQTIPGHVLYCAFEDGERRLQARLAKQDSAPGDNLQFQTEIITLDGGLLNALDKWIVQNPDTKMIAVDTLQKVRGTIPSRANAYAEDYKVMGQLKGLADKHHVAIIVVHHLNKMKDVDDPFDKISGSTGLMGAADTTLLVTRPRGENDATVTFTGRDVYGDDFQIRFENCRWNVVDRAILEQERYENAPIVKAIRLFVEQASFDGTWASSYADFKDYAANHGLFIGANQRDVHRQIENIMDRLSFNDGINIMLDKRIGKGMGFRITKQERS